ncbi:UBA domain-containing protein [Desulfogranum japonicum]|uniref:hypothetical protein n=1 Tax=Desulfogranum japonicum TaxID=231447 RepID=UPI001294665E|nr:hypothetical protein [Desulfogranum japonicum]
MKFTLEKDSEIFSLLTKHPVWAQYYSPDDIDKLVEMGFDRDHIVNRLESVDYSDEYVFPVLKYDSCSPFQFSYYKSNFLIADIHEVTGYVLVTSYSGVQAFCFRYNSEEYSLNQSSPEITEDEEALLKNILGVDSVYPIKVICDFGLNINSFFDPYRQKS